MRISTLMSETNARMRTTRAAALALCSMLACLAGSSAWGAESDREKSEAARQRAEEDRGAAERERRLNDARKRLDEAAREVAELSRQMSEDMMPQIARLVGRQASRAMLGVNISSNRRDDRKDGVEITNVSPGGPAAEAGLKAGDVITEIDGKPLRQEGTETAREKLFAVMRDVEPEQKVQVRYLRDGKSASATLVPTRSYVTQPLRMHLDRLPQLAFIRSYGAFASAELVALTPKLGQYFGTDKGLLVVRAPTDSRLQLEEGDVIVDIDGREPKNAAHALRILGSYQPGEKLKLNVLRMKKRMTFDITMPEGKWGDRFDGEAFREFDIFKHVDPATPAVAPRPAVPAAPPPPMPAPETA